MKRYQGNSSNAEGFDANRCEHLEDGQVSDNALLTHWPRGSASQAPAEPARPCVPRREPWNETESATGVVEDLHPPETRMQRAISRESESATVCCPDAAPSPAATYGIRPTFTRRRNRNRFLPLLWLSICGLFGGLFFWHAFSGDIDATPTPQLASLQPAAVEAPAAPSKYVTRAIRDMRTGHRVLADNPLLDDDQVPPLEIDPAHWRNVRLRMAKADGGQLDIQLLRPVEWLALVDADSGGEIYLDMEEMGAAGMAQVLAIDLCPPVEDGSGRVVTGTFAHTSGDILDIAVEGLDDPIGTTASHPFWSEDRQDFIPAGQLHTRENLRTADGRTLLLTSITPRDGPEAVYNLEIGGQHVYYVSNAGILVHNSCAPKGQWVSAGRSGGQYWDDAVDMHHTIPLGIQKRLREFGNDAATDLDIIGRRGLPNRRAVPRETHWKLHSGKGYTGKGKTGIGGGHYNNAFHRMIERRGDYDGVSKQDLLEIRGFLVRWFEL